jgi:type VI secretion system protein ImpF
MADRPKNNQPLLPSIIDRLIDDDPTVSREAPKTNLQVLRDLKLAVRRDLENLLNTRCRPMTWPEDLVELESSLVNYGIPDFTGSNLRASEDPDILFRAIESAIRNFEPRLTLVRVEPIDNQDQVDRALRFRIDAILHVEPVEEKILFNSRLETSTGTYQVEGESR